MINHKHLKNDCRQIAREPIMLLLFLLPLLIPAIFKIIIVYLVPLLQNYIMFDLIPYYSYILGVAFLLSPGMLGAVTGFMMLDEKDGKISELMSITPLGRFGYIVNRMIFGFVATIIYTVYTYLLLNVYKIPFLTLSYIAILLGVYSFVIGSILFVLADDKIKGLTYAKALNIMMLFPLVDLLQERWVTILAHLFPTYWIIKIIQNPSNVLILLIALMVHCVWLYVALVRNT